MPIYFIADLHLSEGRPDLLALFLQFLQGRALRSEAVYILGDLFDFWIGDDERSELIDTVAQALRQVSGSGVRCYFVHGNRDFLIGRKFAEKCGMTLLPKYHTLDLFGTKALICHGDTLCIDDIRYQQFRRKVHQKWRQRLFLCLPLAWRLHIARKIRSVSKQDKQHKSAEIMDVNPEFTAATVRQYGVPLLIHGHTHREAVHHENGWTRIVLGDWKSDYASILKYDKNGFEFVGR
ncbi:UDP-2,3-diacylglucosamine diphosphatase [Neisseria lisongii]|uniref:UDP-2,3-diacylglucosamine hydrolase n=1 Tax=Neisseria lisongii TaxID=2912188 RepID=A0AAW5AMM3_9NEIS|nr:UDP-2,3-diacylglucosamine diphosphatase [Neisseria lisongii]MCF7530479.1 UDP-2,3-diacylglucosamine diphosphatase [Neisseria lisongii]